MWRTRIQSQVAATSLSHRCACLRSSFHSPIILRSRNNAVGYNTSHAPAAPPPYSPHTSPPTNPTATRFPVPPPLPYLPPDSHIPPHSKPTTRFPVPTPLPFPIPPHMNAPPRSPGGFPSGSGSGSGNSIPPTGSLPPLGSSSSDSGPPTPLSPEVKKRLRRRLFRLLILYSLLGGTLYFFEDLIRELLAALDSLHTDQRLEWIVESYSPNRYEKVGLEEQLPKIIPVNFQQHDTPLDPLLVELLQQVHPKVQVGQVSPHAWLTKALRWWLLDNGGVKPTPPPAANADGSAATPATATTSSSTSGGGRLKHEFQKYPGTNKLIVGGTFMERWVLRLKGCACEFLSKQWIKEGKLLEELEIQYPNRMGLRQLRISRFIAAEWWLSRAQLFNHTGSASVEIIHQLQLEWIRLNISAEKYQAAMIVTAQAQRDLDALRKELLSRAATEATAKKTNIRPSSSSPSSDHPLSVPLPNSTLRADSDEEAWKLEGWILQQEYCYHYLRAEIAQKSKAYATALKHYSKAVSHIDLFHKFLKAFMSNPTNGSMEYDMDFYFNQSGMGLIQQSGTMKAMEGSASGSETDVEMLFDPFNACLPILTQMSHCELQLYKQKLAMRGKTAGDSAALETPQQKAEYDKQLQQHIVHATEGIVAAFSMTQAVAIKGFYLPGEEETENDDDGDDEEEEEENDEDLQEAEELRQRQQQQQQSHNSSSTSTSTSSESQSRSSSPSSPSSINASLTTKSATPPAAATPARETPWLPTTDDVAELTSANHLQQILPTFDSRTPARLKNHILSQTAFQAFLGEPRHLSPYVAFDAFHMSTYDLMRFQTEVARSYQQLSRLYHTRGLEQESRRANDLALKGTRLTWVAQHRKEWVEAATGDEIDDTPEAVKKFVQMSQSEQNQSEEKDAQEEDDQAIASDEVDEEESSQDRSSKDPKSKKK